MNIAKQIKPVILLTLFGLAGVTVISGIETNTRKQVLANQQAHSAEQLQNVLQQIRYDNKPWQESLQINQQQNSTKILGSYRVKREGAWVATVIESETPSGYVGPIRLLTAIDLQGKIIGVRVTAHRETPGLGDKIEAGRSNWINKFTGQSLSFPLTSRWATKKDGGEFDQISGATVTSRAAINAIQDTLSFYVFVAEEYSDTTIK
ncbi:MAG: RnfABCDGE type electron transport complex subunit G [Gammaproteobacteria bacterium]|jgi:Na+-translocating ferredoxin:NAD+ oxidoreductase subunit G|nr:RnfABCDGE type electron transport complex subunit G [Gammaproteobacteria bacterium]